MVEGLNEIPREDRPNLYVVRTAFRIMVGFGFTLIGISLWYWASRRWSRWDNRLLLFALIASGFMGFIALEAGWFVTEVGRQPWVIYGIMRTKDAVTPVPGTANVLYGFSLLYLMLAMLATVLIWLLLRLRHRGPEQAYEQSTEGEHHASS